MDEKHTQPKQKKRKAEQKKNKRKGAAVSVLNSNGEEVQYSDEEGYNPELILSDEELLELVETKLTGDAVRAMTGSIQNARTYPTPGMMKTARKCGVVLNKKVSLIYTHPLPPSPLALLFSPQYLNTSLLSSSSLVEKRMREISSTPPCMSVPQKVQLIHRDGQKIQAYVVGMNQQAFQMAEKWEWTFFLRLREVIRGHRAFKKHKLNEFQLDLFASECFPFYSRQGDPSGTQHMSCFAEDQQMLTLDDATFDVDVSEFSEEDKKKERHELAERTFVRVVLQMRQSSPFPSFVSPTHPFPSVSSPALSTELPLCGLFHHIAILPPPPHTPTLSLPTHRRQALHGGAECGGRSLGEHGLCDQGGQVPEWRSARPWPAGHCPARE